MKTFENEHNAIGNKYYNCADAVSQSHRTEQNVYEGPASLNPPLREVLPIRTEIPHTSDFGEPWETGRFLSRVSMDLSDPSCEMRIPDSSQSPFPKSQGRLVRVPNLPLTVLLLGIIAQHVQRLQGFAFCFKRGGRKCPCAWIVRSSSSFSRYKLWLLRWQYDICHSEKAGICAHISRFWGMVMRTSFQPQYGIEEGTRWGKIQLSYSMPVQPELDEVRSLSHTSLIRMTISMGVHGPGISQHSLALTVSPSCLTSSNTRSTPPATVGRLPSTPASSLVVNLLTGSIKKHIRKQIHHVWVDRAVYWHSMQCCKSEYARCSCCVLPRSWCLL